MTVTILVTVNSGRGFEGLPNNEMSKFDTETRFLAISEAVERNITNEAKRIFLANLQTFYVTNLSFPLKNTEFPSLGMYVVNHFRSGKR